VRTAFALWSDATNAVDDEFDALEFEWSENPGNSPNTDKLADTLGRDKIAACGSRHRRTADPRRDGRVIGCDSFEWRRR
jgi:hypothetical protein